MNLQKIVRPGVAVVVLGIVTFLLGFPIIAIVILGAGALIGGMIGSIDQPKNDVDLPIGFWLIGVFISGVVALVSLVAQNPLYHYATIGWFLGFSVAGVFCLLGRRS